MYYINCVVKKNCQANNNKENTPKTAGQFTADAEYDIYKSESAFKIKIAYLNTTER